MLVFSITQSLIRPHVLAISLSVSLVGCASNNETSRPLTCGSQTTEVSFRVTGPNDAKKFAILLSGSPATEYFSDHAQAVALQTNTKLKEANDPYRKLLKRLNSRGYRVIEAKYPKSGRRCGTAGYMEGFYSACCAQGLENVQKHNADLYDRAVKEVGYDPTNSSHRLVAFGWSLGAIQLETMAFMDGKPFHKIGLTGVLMGDSVRGCSGGLEDGMSWYYFEPLANAITQSTQGCSTVKIGAGEYTHQYNFENFPHASTQDIGLFEGGASERNMLSRNNAVFVPGNPGQVEHIVRARTGSTTHRATSFLQNSGKTTWRVYPGCGHETLYCGENSSPTALDDVLNYLDG